MHNIKTLLEKIQGKWISQKTIYYINNQNSHLHTSDNEIFLEKNVNNLYTSNNALNKLYCLTSVDLNTQEQTSHLFIHNKNKITLKIKNNRSSYNGYVCIYSDIFFKKVFIYNNIKYSEYNYIITQNFQLSIGIIKLKNKYIAVTFTSYIKKIID